MRIIVLSLIGFFSFSILFAQSSRENFYVGTFTTEGAEGIYLCQFDNSSGEISLNRVFKAIDNPNFLKKSRDGKFLYSVSRAPEAVDITGGAVVAYRIKNNGDLEFLNKQITHGKDPCYIHISHDNKWLAVANYGSGSIAVYPIDENGALKPASSTVKHKTGSSAGTRSKTPHAHSIVFSENDKQLFVADLGLDQLLIYDFDKEKGVMTPAAQPFVQLEEGAGPRHFCFAGNEPYCYVANELNSTISVLSYKNGLLTEIQTLSTVPADFDSKSYCADIHLSPDEKFVYVSNRGHQSIAVFAREPNGMLKHIDFIDVKGEWPRNFYVHPSGKFMLIANQHSHNITVFGLENGIPKFAAKELKIPAPVCIEF